jgi:hypothetical protein
MRLVLVGGLAPSMFSKEYVELEITYKRLLLKS